MQQPPLYIILTEVRDERLRQNKKWGEQHHPDGTSEDYKPIADAYRDACKQADAKGEVTWHDILLEEVFEGLAEVDQDKLREELVQIAAVAAAWIEDIDSRESVKLIPAAKYVQLELPFEDASAQIQAGLDYIERNYG